MSSFSRPRCAASVRSAALRLVILGLAFAKALSFRPWARQQSAHGKKRPPPLIRERTLAASCLL